MGIAFAKSDILNQIILNIYTKTKKIFICWNCLYLPIFKLKEKKQNKIYYSYYIFLFILIFFFYY